MINIDDCTNKNQTKDNPRWPYIPDDSYRILIIGGFESGKTNALLNLINNEPPMKIKYQSSISKRDKVGIKHYDDPKDFIEYLNDMQDVYKNIEEYNLGKRCKVLLVFDDVIADMINNKRN